MRQIEAYEATLAILNSLPDGVPAEQLSENISNEITPTECVPEESENNQ
jgi:hypothetical protein